MVPHLLRIIPAIALAMAILPLPYGYYMLLRLIVCGAAVLIIVEIADKEPEKPWILAFGAIAIVFNPILKFHLGREIWMAVDLIACVAFATNYFHIKLHHPVIERLKR